MALTSETTDLLEKLRQKCIVRGPSGIQALGRMFQRFDADGSKSVDLEEFMRGLDAYRTDLTHEEAQKLFEAFDKDGSGTIKIDEFLRDLRPVMSSARKEVVLRAFKKLDKLGDGVLTLEDLRENYDVSEHPKFKSGEMTADELFLRLLERLDTPNDKDGKVTEEEFMTCYSGVSAAISTDEGFVQLLTRAWKLE